jgi:hypothetical protein
MSGPGQQGQWDSDPDERFRLGSRSLAYESKPASLWPCQKSLSGKDRDKMGLKSITLYSISYGELWQDIKSPASAKRADRAFPTAAEAAFNC